MTAYDPEKVYLGPNGHWSKKFIPKTPLGIPQVHPYWNKAAYNHDTGYEGETYSSRASWWNPFAKIAAIRKDRKYRKQIDDNFLEALLVGIDKVKHTLTQDQIERAEEYADVVYESVRALGWSFYRTGKEG